MRYFLNQIQNNRNIILAFMNIIHFILKTDLLDQFILFAVFFCNFAPLFYEYRINYYKERGQCSSHSEITRKHYKLCNIWIFRQKQQKRRALRLHLQT